MRETGNAQQSSPTVADGTVYIGSQDNLLSTPSGGVDRGSRGGIIAAVRHRCGRGEGFDCCCCTWVGAGDARAAC
ncbi:PQQ-binding-like beta-propeller repeat protein [Streptomyces sp. SLBN-8D4]|uniref:PQQ-binding-like beta-propeller repeat protein n=1 Tax=Streptomyces sp. SLBN-8D4 TaxID=3377728 RepID=UPI003C7C791E